jgi:ribosomal protein S7
MENDRFNELINGLTADFPIVIGLNRLECALNYVVNHCGAAGEKTLEEVCLLHRQLDAANNQSNRILEKMEKANAK